MLYINVQWFRGGLVFKAHRLLYHLTLGLRIMKKKKKERRNATPGEESGNPVKLIGQLPENRVVSL